MRRIVNVSPSASAPQLITDYASSYPDGLTLINVSETVTLYLGDDSFVSPDNGVPLPPGMSAPWSGSQELYACVRSDGDPGQLLLTDNIAPLTGQIPPTINPDVWNFGATVMGPKSTVIGTESGNPLAGPSSAQCLFTVTNLAFNGTVSAQLGLIATATGGFTSIASTSVGSANWQGIVDITIPYGGYQIAFQQTSTINSYSFASAKITLARES